MHLIASLVVTCVTLAGPPEYTIVDLGIIDAGDFGMQGLGVSPDGVAVGRSLGVSNQAFSWTQSGGLVPLPSDASRPYAAANDARVRTQQAGGAGHSAIPAQREHPAIASPRQASRTPT